MGRPARSLPGNQSAPLSDDPAVSLPAIAGWTDLAHADRRVDPAASYTTPWDTIPESAVNGCLAPSRASSFPGQRDGNRG
jgi:hypothetical protein